MDAKDIRGKLLSYTRRQYRPFDNTQYLDMSRLGECPRKLAWEMLHGVNPSDDLKMRLCKVQQSEADLQSRLARTIGNRFTGTRPIQALQGKVVGFTNGEADGVLLKIKSVPDDDALPDGRAPNNHYWMTQALMHFGKFARCIVIYESRGSGRIRTYEHLYNVVIGLECERKARLVLSAVNGKWLPECVCGKCEKNGYVEK